MSTFQSIPPPGTTMQSMQISLQAIIGVLRQLTGQTGTSDSTAALAGPVTQQINSLASRINGAGEAVTDNAARAAAQAAQELAAAAIPLAGNVAPTGPLLSSSSGTSAQTANDLPTLDFLGSTINFQRTVQDGSSPTFSGVRAFLDIYSDSYSSFGYGFATVPAFQAIATSHAGSNPGVGALVGSLYSYGTTSGYLAPDVAVTGTVVQASGGTNSTWNFAGQNQDNTGLANHPFQYGIESDLLNNGPDSAASLYNPNLANRFGMLLANKQNPVNSYASSTHFALGTLIVQTPAGGAPTVFIATTAGTTGASPPTWNGTYLSTVTDGTVVWTTGVAYNNVTGTGLIISSSSANSSHNTGIAVNGYVNNAAIDLSWAVMDTAVNAGAAALRIGQNAPIDFSGNHTLAGQNQHTLFYSTYIDALAYQVAGATMFTIADSGAVNIPNGLTVGSLSVSGGVVLEGANLFGVTTGYSTSALTVGRNLSGSGEIDLITASGGVALYAGSGGAISSAYFQASPVGVTTAGVYKVAGTQVIGAQITGYGMPTGQSRIANFNAATATLAQTAEMVAQIITDMKTHGAFGA